MRQNKKNKGQALVEFTLILPIILILILTIIDFGNILYQKYQLENKLDFIIDLYENELEEEINTYITTHNLNIKHQIIDEYHNIELSKNININTPGLNLILNSPYKIQVSRFIYE